VGSDAHRASDVGGYFDEVCGRLDGMGLTVLGAEYLAACCRPVV